MFHTLNFTLFGFYGFNDGPWHNLMFSVVLNLLFTAVLVMSIARCILSVTSFAYKITRPFSLRAARPMVWIRLRSFRRNPSLSASKTDDN